MTPPTTPPTPAQTSDPFFREANCTNYREDQDRPCTGTLRFHLGDPQAACDTCGAWCGWLVADYRPYDRTPTTAHSTGAGQPWSDDAKDALRHARACITQYVATAEPWRYNRVIWAFAIMLGEIPDDTPEPLSDSDREEIARRAALAN